MRDIFLTIIIFVLAGYSLKQSRFGIYAWSFLSYMNPHRFTWGFAYSMPFAQIIAVATLIGILFSKEPKRIPLTGLTLLWMLFIGWMILTTITALHPEYAAPQLNKVIKIQLVTFLTIVVIRKNIDLRILIWVIAFSVGFFGIKGGIFTIATAGAHMVWGPPGSFIEDNNELALALLMVLPLFLYLSSSVKAKYIKYGLFLCMALIAVSIIGSQSRGAFLAIIVTGFFLWLKTPNKLLSGSIIILLAALTFSFMPQSWYDRMETIQNYEEDASAMGRIYAWEMAVNVANNRVVGGGLNMWVPDVYQTYSGYERVWVNAKVAHSIYFSVLGEHGWLGLILFLAIFLAAWRTSSYIVRRGRSNPDLVILAQMIQVSLVAYASGGAFLSLTYFDLAWHLIAILVISRAIVDSEVVGLEGTGGDSSERSKVRRYGAVRTSPPLNIGHHRPVGNGKRT